MARKIAIVGYAESRTRAPFTDTSWEIWGMNDLYAHVPRVTRMFEMHHLLNLNTRRNPNHEQWMSSGANGIPVYMQEKREEFPTSVAFPRMELIECFGSEVLGGRAGCDYVTNSVSWMIALALYETSSEVTLPDGRTLRVCEPGTEIGLWGIQMASDQGENNEYQYQRPSVEFWLGVAKSMGCKLEIPDDCELLKAPSLYGYDTSHPLRVRLQGLLQSLSEKTVNLQQQEQVALQQLEMVRQNLAFIRGAKDAFRQVHGRFTSPGDISVGEVLPEKDRTIIIQPSDGQGNMAGITQEIQQALAQIGGAQNG